MTTFPVCIIGGGPAGMMTAIQLQRYGVPAQMFEKKRLGGLLWNANLVENYPGFPRGIPGPNLIALFVRQIELLDIKVVYETIELLDYDQGKFQVSNSQNSYPADVVIIASGTRPNPLPPNLISDEVASRVLSEVADLSGEKSRKIAIVGAGDAAFDYAINLAQHNEVIILNRSENIEALPLLVTRSKSYPNIQYLSSHSLQKVEIIKNSLKLTLSGKISEQTLYVDYLVGAIGRVANPIKRTNRFLKQEKKLIKENKLHYIGDVKNGIYRQTAIAVGDGLKTAMQIYQYLQEN